MGEPLDKPSAASLSPSWGDLWGILALDGEKPKPGFRPLAEPWQSLPRDRVVSRAHTLLTWVSISGQSLAGLSLSGV